MKSKVLIGTIFLLVAVASLPARAAAAAENFWTRYDHPWQYPELVHAIAFCRIQPRVDPGITLFFDLVEGMQIDKCMRALGWVSVVR